MLDRCLKEPEAIPLPHKIYHQAALLTKINRLQAQMKRPRWNVIGCCHGLAIVWQQKMADNKEQQFYAVIKKIIHQPDDKLAELDDDIDVQKFLAQVEYAQNPEYYDVGLKQIDIDVIMEASKEIYRKEWFSTDSFAKLLNEQTKTRSAVTVTCSASMHTIGIYFRDDQYYLFDGNYETGEAKQFNTSKAVSREMFRCLYDKFGRSCPQWTHDLHAILVKPKPSPCNEKKCSLLNSPAAFFPAVNLLAPPLIVKTEETSELKQRVASFG